MLYLLVSIGFQILFHSPPGVLFTFPSRYYFTIGHQVVFSLTGWSPLIHTGFLVSCLTLDHTLPSFVFHIRDFHSLWCAFPKHFYYTLSWNLSHVLTPDSDCSLRFGLLRFRSPLLTESLRFLFLRVLRCFSSPGSLTLRCSKSSTYWVAPFGYLRIISCVPIPVAFRSLPRPSSPLKA